MPSIWFFDKNKLLCRAFHAGSVRRVRSLREPRVGRRRSQETARSERAWFVRRSRSSRAQAERGRGASRSACRGQSEQEPSTGRRLIFPRWSGKVQGEEKEAGGWRGREDLEQERLRGWEQGEAREHGRFFSSFVTELEALILSNRTALHSPGDPLSSKISIRDHGTRRPQGPGSHFQIGRAHV